MPLVDLQSPDEFDPFAIRGANPLPGTGAPPEDDSAWDVVTAAFRQENIIGSYLTAMDHSAGGPADPDYNPWADVTGTKYEQYADKFAWVNNRAQAEALKSRLDVEEDDRRTLQAAGGWGTLAGMVAGVVDPTVLLPGGAVVRGAKGGYSLTRSAVAGGLAVGAGVAVQEGALQATQELRTAQESGIAIGASVLLGGLLGGGAAGLLARADKKTLASMTNVTDALYGGPAPKVSAGAAAVDEPTLADLTISGKAATVLTNVTGFLSPAVRIAQNPSPTARSIGAQLFEQTFYTNMHTEGRTLGSAAETAALRVANARLIAAVESTNDVYKSMKRSGLNMKRADFEQAVGRAMRRGDQGENDFISQAAAAWRSKVIQPFTDDAIKLGLLPEDVAVTTAESYFNRVWSRERLTREEPRFKQIAREWATQRALNDFKADKEALQKRMAALEEDIADLQLSPEARAARLEEVEAQGSTLDDLYPDQVDRVSDIADLRRQKVAAKGAGQPVDGFDAQIKRLQAEGGDGLKTYLRERARLRKRYRNVDLGFAGQQSRLDKIANQIETTRSANETSMQRLIAKGRLLEKEARRLTPEKFEARVSALRDQFASAAAAAERSVERLTKMREKLTADAADGKAVDAAGAADKLDKELAIQRDRAGRMTTLAERLDAAEGLDPAAKLQEVSDATNALVREVSDLSLTRGEKLQRLKERAARLGPDVVKARLQAVADVKSKAEQRFHQRWSTRTMDDVLTGKTPDFTDHAGQVVDEIFDKLTGRGGGASGDPEFMAAIRTKGPLNERTFNIPDELVEDFLESDASIAMERFARSLSGDLELARRFRHPDMRDQIEAIRTEYRDMRAALDPADPKTSQRLVELKNKEASAITDIEAGRDLVRGTYKTASNSSDWGRVTRAAMHFQYLTKMGGVVIASIGDLYRPAMVHGLRRYMKVLPNLKAIKASAEEGARAGLVGERLLHSRLMGITDIVDPFVSGNPVEKLLAQGSRIASNWNGVSLFTDLAQSLATTMSQDRMIRAALKGDKASKADTALLAMLGIDKGMARRIADQFEAVGENLDGVMNANTHRWGDDAVVAAFRDAIAKDVNSIIVKPGVGDKPLFANTPTGRLILQFRSFSLSANQRVLLRGLQEDKRRFVQGLVAMSAFGMMVAALRSWRGGEDRWEKFQKSAENPGYLIGEGLDNSGIFTLMFDPANTAEKAMSSMTSGSVQFNAIKSPLMAAFGDKSQQGESSRFAGRDPFGGVLGPTAGSVIDIGASVGGGAGKLAKGESPTDAQWRGLVRQVPFSSYIGFREMLQVVQGDSPYLPDEADEQE